MEDEILVLSFDEIWKMLYELYNKIKESNFTPDVIIGITRGGFLPARILSDFFGIRQVTTIGVGFYTDINETMPEPKFTEKFCYNVKNKSILLVDDVSDTGKSLEFTFKYLKKMKIKEIKTATLHYKPQSIFEPDYFIRETSAWIVYPWESIEFARDYYAKRLNQKILPEKILQELRDLGLHKITVKESKELKII